MAALLSLPCETSRLPYLFPYSSSRHLSAPTKMNSLIVVSFALLTAFAVASDLRQNCVLDEFGEEVCTPVSTFATTVRSGSTPCERGDAICWCMKAVQYTNEVRRKNGVKKMLKVGPVKQLDNALWYAEELDKRGGLKHQVLKDVTKEVQCERWVGGENIAYNYEDGDIAKACVRQWENSKLHFQNLIRDWFEEVVIGVHIASDNRVYCVQTFSLIYEEGTYGDLDGARCKAVSDGSSPSPGGSGGSGGDSDREPSSPVNNGGQEEKKPSSAPSPARKSPSPRPARPSPKPAQPSPKPGKERGISPSGELRPMSKERGYHSCRCLEVGSRCWSGMKWRTGGRCRPFRPAMEQPPSCKRKCCQYCKYYPDKETCHSSDVRAICDRR